MRSNLLTWTLVLALVPATVATARAEGLGYTSNVDDENDHLTCSDLQLRFWKEHRGDIVTVRREHTVTLRTNASTPFRVTTADHGGVRVQPSTDGSFSALVCMAAGANSREAGERILDQLEIVSERGELRVAGPERDDWAAEIILSVPKGVALDMSAENGPLSVRKVSGRFTLRTINGPISVVRADGVVDADAQNGPIRYVGHSGDVQLVTQNGPINVELDETKWSGKGLDASTQNGPVRLLAPSGFKSGVEVKGSEWSPVKWDGDSRSPGVTWIGDQTFRLGQGPALVRLSTVNGPIQIGKPKSPSRGTSI